MTNVVEVWCCAAPGDTCVCLSSQDWIREIVENTQENTCIVAPGTSQPSAANTTKFFLFCPSLPAPPMTSNNNSDDNAAVMTNIRQQF